MFLTRPAQKEKTFLLAKNWGKSVMEWGATNANGVRNSKFLRASQDSQKYFATLSESFLRFFSHSQKSDWIFQQSNAPFHICKL